MDSWRGDGFWKSDVERDPSQRRVYYIELQTQYAASTVQYRIDRIYRQGVLVYSMTDYFIQNYMFLLKTFRKAVTSKWYQITADGIMSDVNVMTTYFTGNLIIFLQ